MEKEVQTTEATATPVNQAPAASQPVSQATETAQVVQPAPQPLPAQSQPDNVSLDDKNTQTDANISKEELSIEDLHADLEAKLTEQGFIFDKKKFIFEDKHLTLGERLADKVASFGGSWTFIALFMLFIAAWIGFNIYWLFNQGFDPYPFILLNLILSCLASLQAPVIMMSQNRQSVKDRKQEAINIEKEILDFKQDRLDLILDQKQWDLMRQMDENIRKIELATQKKAVVATKSSANRSAKKKKR